MSQKVLIISPTPTHPTNAGNRARIYVYSKYLISLGHEVHFLYSDQEDSNIEAMQQYWGPRFHHVLYQAPKRLNFSKWLILLNSNYKYYCRVDDYYNELLDEQIIKLHEEHSFTAVFIEYIFLTKAFFNFDEKVIKIVDTHDVMTKRHKHFLNAGKEPVWYSTPRREEKRGIDRADIVMAIQDREAEFYRKLTNKRVVTVGHLVDVVAPSIKEKPRTRLLFVGSNNPNNFHAITDFIKNYFPVVKASFPDLELYIAGRIGDSIEKHPDIIKVGEIEDIKKAYQLSDIVFNPLTIGTGLKIKMIEALGFGKAVISTTIGAEGLEEGSGSAYLIADTPETFNNQFNRLLNDPECYKRMVISAHEFVLQYNLKPCSALSRIVCKY